MAYTPINWQTGDTITADKLNKMDNGWGVQETQLFSETVTTVEHGGFNSELLSYASLITAETIIVTFDGTEYVCTNVLGEYGAPYDEGTGDYDFSTYPFNIRSSSIEQEINNLITTQTAGEHTITVSVDVLECGTNFTAAVKSIVDADAIPLNCVSGTTTRAEMVAAESAGRLMYFTSDGYFIITGSVSHGSMSFIPTQSGLHIEFDENDLFNIYYS